MYYVFYDDETTGAAGLICQIGAIVCDEDRNVINRFTSLVNPHAKVDWYVAKNVTGINNKMLVGAPEFVDVWRLHIAPYLKNGVLVAHGAKSADLHHIAKTAAARNMNVGRITYVDTLEVSKLFADHEKHNLAWLAVHYGVSDDNHHDALNDAEVLMKVYWKMVDEINGALAPKLFDTVSRKTVEANQLTLNLDAPKPRASAKSSQKPRHGWMRDLKNKTVVLTGELSQADYAYLTSHAREVHRGLSPKLRPAFVLIGEHPSVKLMEYARMRKIPLVNAKG